MADTFDTNTPDGDFLTVLSSELIAEVMEEYFNKKMYRQKVKVVDLQPQGSGYAFSLAFVKDTSVKNMEFTPEWLAQSAPKYDIYAGAPGNVTPVLIEKDVELSNNGSAIHRTLDSNDTVPVVHCIHGMQLDNTCAQCQLDTITVTGGIRTPKHNKGKFTKKDKVQ